MSTERVVKFRAWDEQENKMVYNFRDTDRGAELNEIGILVRSCWHTLQQFTGYKTKSDQEIFEGDIMALKNGDGSIMYEYEVKYEDAKFVLYHTKKDYGKWGDLCRIFDYDFNAYDFSVIGHIYSPPSPIKEDSPEDGVRKHE